MTLFQAIVLALVQGATEFLPISSSGHLFLVSWLLGWPDPGLTFTVAVHAGTLAALLVYFTPTWVALLGSLVSGRSPEPAVLGGIERPRRLLAYLVVATIPGGIAGYLLEDYAETVFRAPHIVAAALILAGLVMWLADQMEGLSKKLNQIEWGDALTVGAAQALAIIPGVSRAGITIATGMFRGLERETAARFSFLLATPIIAGAAVKTFAEVWVLGLPAGVSKLEMAVAFLVSAVSGYAAIAFLLRYLEAHTLTLFIVYRILLGLLIFYLQFTK